MLPLSGPAGKFVAEAVGLSILQDKEHRFQIHREHLTGQASTAADCSGHE